MSQNVEPPANPEREIFLQALEKKSAPERAAFLDGACGGDARLRAAVDSLLANADDSMLDQVADEARPAIILPVTEQPGDRIGRYRLLQRIGEGGMGVVYMAEQEEPVRRQVALKIIKLGMDTRSVVARFEAERQALALMDHPNIARVLDAGATGAAETQISNLKSQIKAGRPYFVMELVRGVPITSYCDKNHLGAAARLGLFIQVCQAIQHAHQKGIIHRDIKPSNVMVTLHDGVPVPKVIDFGVAKATGQRLTEKTLFTHYATMVGTPAYMSPEQAEMSGLDIDTRTDVYALGVLLYELLTGTTPFPADELLSKGYGEMQRIIAEVEPARPSTRLSTMQSEERTVVAKNQGTNEVALGRGFKGDLDWIVMKCLEKDRARRYETANGLAADLQRHLNNEPVVARPPSRAYQLQKLVHRNRGAFAAAAAVLLALVTGLALATWAFVRERAARQQTAIEAAKSQQVAMFLKEMFRGVEPSVALGRDVTVLREITDQTLERIGQEQSLPPKVEVQLHATLGGVYHHLGDLKKAEAMHRVTLPKMRALLGAEHPEVAELLRDFACVLDDRRKHKESEALGREALALGRKLHGPEHPDVAKSLELVARSLSNQKRFAEGETLLLQSLDMNRKVQGPEHHDVALGLGWLAEFLDDQGRIEESEAVSRQALVMMKKVRGDVHPDVAWVLTRFAEFHEKHGKSPEAEELYRELLPIKKKLFGNEAQGVATTLNNLGTAIHNSGRSAEAEPYLREALALYKRLGNEGKDSARTMYNLGIVLRELERLPEAESMFRDALAIRRKLLRPNDPDLELTLRYLGRVLAEQRKFAEAEALFTEWLALVRKTAAKDPEMIEDSLNDLAEIIYRAKRYAEAEPLYQELVQSRRRRLPPAHNDVLSATGSLARLLADWAWAERSNTVAADVRRLTSKSKDRNPGSEIDQSLVTSTATLPVGRAREGERLLSECLAHRLAGTNAANWRTSDIRSRLGAAILSVAVTDASLSPSARERKFSEAEALLHAGNEGLLQRQSDRKYQRDALERLIRLYEAWNKPDRAAEWRAKLERFDQPEAETESASARRRDHETLTPPSRSTTPERITL